MAAADRRKSLVFSVVLLAALVATSASYVSLFYYVGWKNENSDCSNETLAYNRVVDRTAESALKNFAAELDDKDEWYDTSYRADGRVLFGIHRFKKKLPINLDFGEWVNEHQKGALEMYCADEEEDDGYLRSLKAIWTKHFTVQRVSG